MKALIVVDVQYDFLPVSEKDFKTGQGGALAVKEGDKIIPIINKLLPKFDLIIFTMDWHPPRMEAFASSHEGKNSFDTYIVKGKEDTLWPDHCVKNTRGAQIHEDINLDLINGKFYIFKKGLLPNHHPYSGFDGTGLAFFLQSKEVDEIYVCGLATDFCAAETAMDGIKNNFKTSLILDACKPINPNISNLLKKLKKLNINVIKSQELLY